LDVQRAPCVFHDDSSMKPQLSRGEVLTVSELSRRIWNNGSAIAEMGDRARVKWAEKWGCCAPFRGGSWVSICENVAWAEACLRIKCYPDPSSRLAAIDMGRKVGRELLCPFPWGLSLHLTQCGLDEACLYTSGILIHSTVWPQYTNVTGRQTDRQTDRQDRQRSDSIGRTVL